MAQWFVSKTVGVSFFDFVSSSFPHLVHDLTRDCASGSSQLLSALRSSQPSAATSSTLPLPAPRSFPSNSSPSVPPFAARFAAAPVPPPTRFPAPHTSPVLSSFPFSSASSAAPPLPHISLPLPHSGASSSFPSSSFASDSAPSYPGEGSAVVQVLGAGILLPSSSGVPPFPPFVPATPSSHTGLPFAAAAAATASHASSFDPHAPVSAPCFEDPLFYSPDRPLEDDVAFADPSAPPLSLDYSRSEYRRMAEYILGLFPQAAGVPPSASPPRALFESFFAASAPSPPTLHFNWFDRLCQSLMEADSRMAAFLASGRSDRSFLPSRHLSYAVRGEHWC